MNKRSILHMLDPMPHNSPFDVNMAMDAGFDILMPYNNVKLDNIHGLIQDAIFSRGPTGIKKTAAFIGGRDMKLTMEMLEASRQAMVPPFAISVLADPSGAFTTAAALVACVEQELKLKQDKNLQDCKAIVFGGTGSVGIACSVIAALVGAKTTLVDHFSLTLAQEIATEYSLLFSCKLSGERASSDKEKISLIEDIDVIFCTAKAGVQVLGAEVLRAAKQLKVAGDVNAVPPAGIAGIKAKHFGESLLHAPKTTNAIGIGALAVGDIKYKVQQTLLQRMLKVDKPHYLDFRDAFAVAREILELKQNSVKIK